MTHFIYILCRLSYDLASVFSRTGNALFLGGSTAQTMSSHCHINPNLSVLRGIINVIFFWEEDHCEGAWLAEVERALHTLDVHGAITVEEYNVI